MLQHISKTVNLDEMISRFPGMLYAIQEKTDEYGISYYDYDTVSGFTGLAKPGKYVLSFVLGKNGDVLIGLIRGL